MCKIWLISGNVQYIDADVRTTEFPQRTRILKNNYRLKIHNAHFKLATAFLEE